jgi:dipeptidyl aminopeptidase/acylaminoacyl peptidase
VRRLFILLIAILPAFAQTKHAFTFEDMMALKRVGDPQPSPDGKWVLFTAVDVSLEHNTRIPHVWVVPTAGGEAREIIFTQESDRPRWAPDSKRFAFLSTKEQGSQVWVADFDGDKGTVTAVHKLTFFGMETDGELWSPDGKSILFVSNVYPECDSEVFVKEYNCNLGKRDEAEKSKVKAMTFTGLLYRHWNAYKNGMRSHIFVMPAPAPDQDWNEPQDLKQPRYWNLSFYRDLTPGDYDAPVFSLGGQDNYAFAPDGQEVAYSSNHDKVEATSTNGDIWLVPVKGGQSKNITADNLAGDFTPLYSPDGKYIAYRAQKRPGYESDQFRLMLYDRASGKSRELVGDAHGFSRWVGSFSWAANSTDIFFTAEREGSSGIYLATLTLGAGQGGLAWQPGQGGYDDDLIVSKDGKTLVFTHMTLERPIEIYQRDVAYAGPHNQTVSRPLTHINDAVLAEVDMFPLDPFWFEGAKGEKVQGFLVKPPNFDASKKYPVKFLIHGGPQGAWGDDWSYRWNPELFAANGYVVIMINFHGSTGYGQKFVDEINGNWGGAPFEDLMKGLDYAEKNYSFIDKDRECALGASYGGYMINWILGHTNRFKCLVSHDGMFNTISAWGTTEELWFNEWEFKGTPYTNREMYDKWSPNNSAKNFKTPTLVVHGQLDYRLDVSEGFQLFTTLQREGVPSKMLYFPDEGHWVLKPQNSQLWYKTVNAWVDQWTEK